MAEQRTLHAVDGIGCRCGYTGDILYGPRPFIRRAPAKIPSLPARIGAHDQKIAAAAKVLMAHSGGNGHDIARFDVDLRPALTTKMHTRRATGNSQNFVGRAVEVMKGINAIAPTAAPTIAADYSFAYGRGVIRREF